MRSFHSDKVNVGTEVVLVILREIFIFKHGTSGPDPADSSIFEYLYSNLV